MNNKMKRALKIFRNPFNKRLIAETGKKTKFIYRERKLTAENFLALCTFSEANICDESLTKLCTILRKNFGTTISTEGLNSRFNDNAVEFMKSFFLKAMIQQNKILEDNFDEFKKVFSRIRILDSTHYSLPEKLQEYYCGNGGGASKSAVKLHLEFDLLTGTFINLEVSSGTKNDMDYGWDILNTIEKNDLCIRDLGYYSSLHFKKLAEKGSYYISKIKSNTKIYSYDEKYSKFSATEYKKGELFEIDIAKISETLTPNETFELADILIGKTHLCKNRLIITKLSEQIKQEREEKRKANAKKNKVKKSISTLDGLNAYITNVPNETLSTMNVYKLYATRWQVEIMFKIWKSIFGIHLVNKVKVQRFECFIYGRLIALLLTSTVVNTVKLEIDVKSAKDISIYKSFDIVKLYLKDIGMKIFDKKKGFYELMEKISQIILQLGIKSIRKNRFNMKKILLEICLS
jgi:S-adenosylmethionine hydrolase